MMTQYKLASSRAGCVETVSQTAAHKAQISIHARRSIDFDYIHTNCPEQDQT